jgi:hypothetical protein
MEKPRNPILISIIAYSLLVVAGLTMTFILFTAINVETNNLNDSETLLFSKNTGLFFPLFFISIVMIDLIFIIKHKNWAYILFFLLGLFLFVILIVQKPLDWLSMSLLAFILIVFLLFRPQKPLKTSENDLPDDDLE